VNEERAVELLRLTGTKPTTSIVHLVDMFLQHNEEEELSAATITTRKTHLNQLSSFCTALGLRDVSVLNNQFIDQYFVEYRHEHARSTTNTGKRIIKVFLTWVRDYKEVDLRAVPENIKSAKERYKIPKSVDRAIIEKVVSECPNHQDRLIISLFAESGIRNAELTKVRVSDIQGERVKIHGKGGMDRTVLITRDLSVALLRFAIDTGREPDDYLFHPDWQRWEGSSMSTDTVYRRVVKRFNEIAGIHATPHQLRHSFAIELLTNGCDIVTIKDLLGHEDINTTMVYLRLADSTRKNNYDKHIGKSFLT